MSSPRPAGAQGSIGRPAVVTAAARLYVAAAALAATYAVLVFTQVGTVADAEGLAEAAHLDTNSNVVAIATSFALLGVAGLIFAGLFTRSGVHLLRGSYGSRGGAWGVTALAVVCLACNLTITGTATGRRPFNPVDANVADALPLWYVVTAITLQVVALILILAGAVLLTRPAAAAYVTTPGLRSDQEAGITRR